MNYSNFNTDKPKKEQTEDYFQRYDFSKRIAEMVSNYRGEKSLVVGIYGKWGEGKSSVLNFIQSELSTNTAPIFFNPWLYSDERNLLNSFFSTIANTLNQTLKTNKEKIGEFFTEYAGVLGIFTQFAGASTDGLKDLGQKLSSVPLETIKNKIAKLLLESEKSIVVFMDDIDRLDINEIQSIFRLVKLTGDFPNITYILAFDEEIVAKALSSIYPSEKKESGYLYLEKIIQVPLKLPKANSNTLRTYTLNLLESTLKSCSISLSDHEKTNFLQIFDNSFVKEIKNPRIAVRYTNSLLFSIPLLRGEVNITDLLTLEGLKNFFPVLYDFIRLNPNLLLVNREFSDDDETVRRLLDKFLKSNYQAENEDKLISLLSTLFPKINKIYENFYLNKDSIKNWNKEKRICSAYHFERYFSYSVQKGDISDIFFEQLLTEFDQPNQEKAFKMLRSAFSEYKPHELIFKFRLWEGELSSIQCQNIVTILSGFGDSLPKEEDFHFATTFAQAASTIAHFFFSIEKERRLHTLIVALNTNNFSFALEIAYSVFQKNTTSKKEIKLNSDEEQEIERFLLNRWISYLNDNNFFELVQDIDLQRLLLWWKKYDEKNLKKKIKKELKRTEESPLKLLKVFCPTTTSYSGDGTKETYKVAFLDQHYNFMKSIFDPNILFIQLKKHFHYTKTEFKISDEDYNYSKADDNTLVGMFYNIHLNTTGKEN